VENREEIGFQEETDDSAIIPLLNGQVIAEIRNFE
jgi:hypothetical protein